ncbi:DUF2164 domain-containing protein [Tissierella sp.]|uniref:DUF2164 domain-containing protein n=1 Tax=Tissierella sp. TaxID=41274 RepID=UPI002862D105|nr:DUF2164 domain-containing protein [Tissierella sp.]MDR7856772.1 DUF2164 domain-containing protein [Tissierella sp.]
MNNRINFSKEIKEEMRNHIINYFLNERDEELGDLSSQLLLDFFIEELAPYVYNQGIEDAYICIKDKVEDLFALQIIRR